MQFALQQGDVIVVASDGLFDNIWDEQVGLLMLCILSLLTVSGLSCTKNSSKLRGLCFLVPFVLTFK